MAKKSGIGNGVWQGIHRCGCGRQLLTEGRLGEMLDKKYPAHHDIRTDKALYNYSVFNIKELLDNLHERARHSVNLKR